MSSKEFAFQKSQAYKSDALYWNDKANDYYKTTSNLLTTISVTALGFITIFLPGNVSLSFFDKFLFLIIIISSVVSICASLWQGYTDQRYFVDLSSDSSKRQAIWENDTTSEIIKKQRISTLKTTNPASNTSGIKIQMVCLALTAICLLFLGISRLFFVSREVCMSSSGGQYAQIRFVKEHKELCRK